MKIKKNLIFNIGYGKPSSINYLANLISDKFINIPNDPENLIAHMQIY